MKFLLLLFSIANADLVDNCTDSICNLEVKENSVLTHAIPLTDKSELLAKISNAPKSWGRPQEQKDVCPSGHITRDENGDPVPLDDRTPLSVEVVSVEYDTTDEDGNVTGTASHDCDRYTYPADFVIELTNAQAEKDEIDGVTKAINDQACGGIVKALMVYRNSNKDLTQGEKMQILSDYAAIEGLLDTGSLDTAKAQILGITPDGRRVVQADIDALAAKIDECSTP